MWDGTPGRQGSRWVRVIPACWTELVETQQCFLSLVRFLLFFFFFYFVKIKYKASYKKSDWSVLVARLNLEYSRRNFNLQIVLMHRRFAYYCVKLYKPLIRKSCLTRPGKVLSHAAKWLGDFPIDCWSSTYCIRAHFRANIRHKVSAKLSANHRSKYRNCYIACVTGHFFFQVSSLKRNIEIKTVRMRN